MPILLLSDLLFWRLLFAPEPTEIRQLERRCPRPLSRPRGRRAADGTGAGEDALDKLEEAIGVESAVVGVAEAAVARQLIE